MKRFLTALSIAVFVLCCACLITVDFDSMVFAQAKAESGTCVNHVYANNGEYTVINEATCTLKGTKYRSCLVCGSKDIVETPKNPDNHSSVSNSLTYETKPTCVSGGVGHYVCRGCNKSAKMVDLPADPQAHTKNGDFVVLTPETCQTEGTMAHQCKDCDEYFNHQTISANPDSHVTSENSTWVVNDLPTCSAAGSMTCYCDLCGNVAITKEVPATGNHTPAEEWSVVQAETCSSDGVKAQLCTVCSEPQNSTAIPADESKHVYSEEFTVDVKPTCVSSGEKSRHCMYCSAKTDVTYMPLEVDAHAYADEWIYTKEATCSESGYKHKLCTLCGVSSVATLVPKLSHTYPETYEVLQNSADGLSARVKYICTVCGYEYITIISFGDNSGEGNIGDDTDPYTKIHKIVLVDKTVIKVDYETMLITNVIRKMSVADFLAKFKNSNVYVIYDKNQEFVQEEQYIATGHRLNYETPDGVVTNYYVSVTGDVDSDGMITAADARLVLRASAKMDTLTGAYFVAADVNGDGKITAADARRILLVAAGLDFFDETYEMP